MRRLALLFGLTLLLLAGCGGEQVVLPTAETVEGTLPTTTTQAAAVKGDPKAGSVLFTAQGCNGCHTFKPADSTGTVGPDLDDLTAEAKQAGKPLEDFIRESIVDPDAYVAPRYPKGVMPKTFSALPPAQIDALVKFLSGGSK